MMAMERICFMWRNAPRHLKALRAFNHEVDVTQTNNIICRAKAHTVIWI